MRALLVSMVLLGAAAQAQTQTPAAAPLAVVDNARLTALFDADQGDRVESAAIDWTRVWVADDRRRAEVDAMLKAGAVRSGTDYWHAAFIYQHGDAPRDYLLAHTLAVTAVTKGHAEAGWIAAATLDRYLGAVGQPQIYGTQYRWRAGRATTQEPYDRTLLGDEQRQAIGVKTLAEQAEKLKAMEAERAAATPPR